jgi:hypothetical protein
MNIPEHIFFTGVPGSRWSGIAQVIETIPGFNTSDRTPERTYDHHAYSGHKGAYFGREMEFEPTHIYGYKHFDQAWTEPGGHKLIKSHDWAYSPQQVKVYHPDSWFMMVYRPDMASYAWWHEAGGFKIQYPDYSWYKNSAKMLQEIQTQNTRILEYACEVDAKWEYFTQDWVEREFGHKVEWPTQEIKDPYGKQKTIPVLYKDILVTLIK